MPLKLFSRKSRNANKKRASEGQPRSLTVEQEAAEFEPAPYEAPSENALLQLLQEQRYCILIKDETCRFWP